MLSDLLDVLLALAGLLASVVAMFPLVTRNVNKRARHSHD